MDFEKDLAVTPTNIPGLLVVDLSVHGDSRGWFKENWQRQKMVKLGLPDFRAVQNNISFNTDRGVTRGIHAEPWDKYVSVATGAVFGAWVDLREGPTFGETFTCRIDPSVAVFVPRGVGNAFQSLEDGTAYTYLVNDHWSTELKASYTFLNLADDTANIAWPIPLSECVLSDADKAHPQLADVQPMKPKKVLVTGAGGQLATAIEQLVKQRGIEDQFDFVSRADFDISAPADYQNLNWSNYGAVINCAAYTSVDHAETAEGRVEAWKANATGPALLAGQCTKQRLTLIHISSEYVFDGTHEAHEAQEPLSPLGVYGQSKAAGEVAVGTCPDHYIVRTSWVVGHGHNFIRTMERLSDRVGDPNDQLTSVTVVDDQFGRLTFAEDLAQAVLLLVKERPKPGVYQFTNPGPVTSWYEIAREVFAIRNGNKEAVTAVTTEEYMQSQSAIVAPRPRYSALARSELFERLLETPTWQIRLKKHWK